MRLNTVYLNSGRTVRTIHNFSLFRKAKIILKMHYIGNIIYKCIWTNGTSDITCSVHRVCDGNWAALYKRKQMFLVFQSCDKTFQHRSFTHMLRAAVNHTHTTEHHLTDYMQTQFCVQNHSCWMRHYNSDLMMLKILQ